MLKDLKYNIYILLKTSDVLQVDAIIITGVLILLTISADHFNNPNFLLGKGVSLLALAIIFPFAVSAILALRLENYSIISPDEQKQNTYLRNSIFWMIAGFAYMLVFLTIYTGTVLFSS